jgi:hypothetical protein
MLLSRKGAIMAESVADRLEELPKLSKTALCNLWNELFETSPPPGLRARLMVPILAYRLQEQMFGSLSSSARNQLRKLARAFEVNPKCPTSTGPSLKPGTRLVRRWRDQVHLVSIEDGWYEYQGGRYHSLSEIARQITGTRWSGPLFFGLRDGKHRSTGRVQ